MSFDVVVIDYGVGNLYSVRRAFEYCDANVLLTDDVNTIISAKRLVLPGVGAFADGMRGLVERKLDIAIHDFVLTGKPLLGICLGMQMLASTSEEFGEHTGLGLIPGKVIPIPQTKENGEPHKIPHIGWEGLMKPDTKIDWSKTILESIEPGDSVYHIHSYTFVPTDVNHRLALCDYNGRKISSVVRKENVVGCQFHPEKSGKVGLKILKNFLELNK